MWQERLRHWPVYIHPSSPCSAEMEEKQLACPHPFKDKLKHTPLFLTQAPVPSCSFHIALGCNWVHSWCSFRSICCVALFTSSSNGPSTGQRSLTSSSMPQEQALAKGSRSSGAWTTGLSGLTSLSTMQNSKQRNRGKQWWNAEKHQNAKWAPCLYLLWSAPKDWKHFALAGLSCQSECCRSTRRDDFKPRHLVRFNSNHSNVEAQPSKRSGHLWPTVNLTDFSHFFPISSNHPNMSIHVNTYTVLYTDHHLWSSVKSANHWWRLGGFDLSYAKTPKTSVCGPTWPSRSSPA